MSSLRGLPVAVVAGNALRTTGTTELATAYLDWLYTPPGAAHPAQNYYRVTDETVAAEVADTQAPCELEAHRERRPLADGTACARSTRPTARSWTGSS